MGSSHRFTFPWGADFVAKNYNLVNSTQTFNGLKAIQDHIRLVSELNEYVCGRTTNPPQEPLACHPGCQVAIWSYSENAQECSNRELMDAVCNCCEEFIEHATHSVMLTKMDLPGPSSDVIRAQQDFEDASNRLQDALAELHIDCRLDQ